ncbi:MAG: hypothetical protein CMI54_08185 [Parcubacteria group bacterium]|nr:hypothetical protein [Parcubacteria group bacterium]|tara:strand:- start:2970 stop:3608 length:639 start_codon:yes stop_codon:yes gene_type:complete
MALVINDRVKETSATTGTGAMTFAGATSGFETFSAGIGNSNTTYYAIVNTDTPTEWEVGLGTLAGDSSTITRTTVISSSNSDAAVSFTSGTKEIFCTLPASKASIRDANGYLTFTGGAATALDLTTSQGTLEVLGDGSSNVAALLLNCELNTHGVTIKSPVHASASTYSLTLPTAVATTAGSSVVSATDGTLSYGAVPIDTGKSIAMAIVFG